MPTFTAVAFENLLHHKLPDSPKKPVRDAEHGASKHLIIMPALYSTPEQAPLPENTAPHSPSPYVVNHKRRLVQVSREGDELSLEQDTLPVEEEEEEEEEVGDNSSVGGDDSSDEDEGFFDRGGLDLPSEDYCESAIEETTDVARDCMPRSFVSAPGEFFDATDEFTSDGSTSEGNRIELELHNSRVSLLEEICSRKSAEERLALMCNQWEMIKSFVSEAGLTFPSFPADGMHFKHDSADQISQEITVARYVAESIGRGEAREEAEAAAAAIIESKDQELLRLRDRLQYYETVNHELSQRNLVEVARRQQERKTRRRRWVWGLMGLSITAGVSLLVYSCIPAGSKQSSSILELDKGCGDA